MLQFKTLVDKAQKILIVGHQTPDFDCYSCSLFVYNAILHNFKDKDVHVCLDTAEPFTNLSFLKNFDKIEYGDICDKTHELQPDLIVFVDGSSIDAFSNKKAEKLRTYVQSHVSIMVDHHEVRDTEFDLLFNQRQGSCVEVLHALLIRKEKWELFEGWEDLYMTGMIGDSYRFYYPEPGYRENFEVVSSILDKGKTIREYSDKIFDYTPSEFTVLSELFKNIQYVDNYAFTFMTYDYYRENLLGKISIHVFKKDRRFFIDEFLNKLSHYDLTFTLVPNETVDDGKTYAGSFRSKLNTYDTTILAKEFGGGGHVTGSGFSVVANSVEEAVEKVKKMLGEKLESARITIA